MFQPSLLSQIGSGGADVRKDIAALVSGIIGQLRDVATEPMARQYLSRLELEIPAIVDAISPKVVSPVEVSPVEPEQVPVSESEPAMPLSAPKKRPSRAKGKA